MGKVPFLMGALSFLRTLAPGCTETKECQCFFGRIVFNIVYRLNKIHVISRQYYNSIVLCSPIFFSPISRKGAKHS